MNVIALNTRSEIQMSQHLSRPRVSIVMANYNGASYIEDALRSALSQSIQEIEIIVVDDASLDDSVARVTAIMASDDRVKLLCVPINGGASHARNHALDAARGEWIAIMDSDDLMHPKRLARLLDAAKVSGADIIADDLLVFDETNTVPPYAMLNGQGPTWINAASYVKANALSGPGPALGYLKPLFRHDLIAQTGLRYDESLSIAEDYAFVLSLLMRGALFEVVPDLTYFYRKHSRSLSHRLSRNDLQSMLDADDRFHDETPQADKTLRKALAHRRKTIETSLAFDTLMTTLKQRRWATALRYAFNHPQATAMLRIPLRDRLRRLLHRSPSSPVIRKSKSICLISRQRIVGAMNGSSVYLLSLCAALRDDGFDVHLVSPSPTVFGSWPVLFMRPEMSVFRSIRIRGAWHIGRLIIARDPRVAIRASLSVACLLLRHIGIHIDATKAPYAIASPWQSKDFLFVARHARCHGDALLADYAFLTEGLPYALRPDAPSGVVMHDLFSSHAEPPPTRPPPLVRIDCAKEMEMLGGAEAVIAIQSNEASTVTQFLPNHRVIVAPMATRPVPDPQPGVSHMCLFVGSNAEPNIIGLQWFLTEVWPLVRAAVPYAELNVAGGVAAGVSIRPAGVNFLGQVSDLRSLYREAGVVVSPLRFGSGLKIKLVEALSQGKAAVVTSITMQGVEAITAPGVLQADLPDMFAAAMISLMQDDVKRIALCRAALSVARLHFAPGPSYKALTTFFAEKIHVKSVGAA